MIQKHRISTNIGDDKKILVELKQDFDLLEILSLKFTQKDIYSSVCSDYGVVCGRITLNNGLGVPNAKISIFIPLSDEDSLDPVISQLYPYQSISDVNEDGYRYNLLPARKQHGGHEPTGTFPDQTDILTREEILEVYEKYYKYTVKTNDAGDFMIWGVPVGEHILHVDVDLSDMGCFSLRPHDFIDQGVGIDNFKNSFSFKASSDLNSLPQIINFNKTINVYSFWGNEDLCEIGITRTDFDLSEVGVKIEPKATLLGSIFSDSGNNSVNKNCRVRPEMGTKCGLIAEEAIIEVLRFSNERDSNNRPILEFYEINGDIDDSGSFALNLPMNMEYLYTNEFGENEVTNDPNKGVPTSACYRFRISTKNESLGRVRTTASYLVPNIREFDGEIEKSYTWSDDWNDYPSQANSFIFNNIEGSYYPQDYFYRFNYNKVYAVSSFFGSYDGALTIKEISPKPEDDCENNVVTPPINFATRNFSFSTLLAIVINTIERIIFYAFIAAIQILIAPFQLLWNFRIFIRAFGITLIDWRPFQFFDSLVIEPLQRFGTVRLGIVIYPECETCDNLDFTNDPPIQSIDPEIYYTQVGSGTAYPDTILKTTCGTTNFDDTDPSLATIYIQIPSGIADCSPPLSFSPSLTGVTIETIDQSTGRFFIKVTSTGNYGELDLETRQITDISGVTHTLYYFNDTRQITWSGGTQQTTPFSYKIFDSESPLSGETPSGNLNSELQGSCQQYVTVYKESIVGGTYCVVNPSTPYSALTTSDIITGTTCTSGKVIVGQVIRNTTTNPCLTCGTRSGFSEFRYGLFTIVPAASTSNWGPNFDAITEYSRRKLVAKLFCGGVGNYSFMDNWLTGALYMFPFKAKVRWNDEENLDLDVNRTKYCNDLVYFKVGTEDNPDKRFYYRSTVFNGTSFVKSEFNLIYTTFGGTLGHPTTIVDLGPRDEFIKDICIDPSVDPNCSVVRNIGSTSYQNFKELFGLYINYKLDYLSGNADITSFFENDGFKAQTGINNAMNGDILQLISINNEAGIEEFDLQNRNYAVYSPQVLDIESYPTLFNGGPFPINFVLDDGEGYRIRTCLNEPGRLGDSSQTVPFYLWNKNGTGFGSGSNQSWNYSSVQSQPLQGMTFAYNYNGNTSHQYSLPPMTKLYSGDTFTFTGITLNDVNADVEVVITGTTGSTLSIYDNQLEGFTVLEIISGSDPASGTLWTRTGDTGNWASVAWTNDVDFVIKPTTNNYSGNTQILSTPFLFYFGLRPGKTAIDKFIKQFGPSEAFTSID
jgi:hypothetical protein